MDVIAECIEQLTNDLAGDGEGVHTRDTIEILLKAENCPNLTLIDLPGIVSTTTEGQNESIVAEIDNLVMRYMKQKRTIILAIVEAPNDIANANVLTK